jgi:tryptophanyl-tRNA synthetase
VEPEVLLPDNAACLRLPGTDGKAKMSKSLGNCIYLADTEADVKKKIMNMYTDPTHIQISDPGHIEGNCVFTYLDAFSNPGHFEEYLPEYQNLDELKEHYKRGGLGDVKIKKFLNNVIQEELAPIRARRAEFERDIPAVYDILKKGSDVAREAAAQTLSEVKRAMRINYFEDEELIRAQSEKYVR